MSTVGIKAVRSGQVHFFRGIAATPQALVVVGSSIGQLLVFEMLQDSTPESLVLLHEIQVAACPIVCCCADEVCDNEIQRISGSHTHSVAGFRRLCL
jgi:hypothetical protein